MTSRTAPMAALRAALALLVLVAAIAAAAAPATPAAKAPSARGSASPAKPAAARPARPGADSLARSAPGGRSTPRVLDDIHIEGEIPVPQVLFITAREQRRFMEFQHHRYARTSLELGRGTAMPSRVVVPEPGPAERKEIQR